jgi:hypothetical protein
MLTCTRPWPQCRCQLLTHPALLRREGGASAASAGADAEGSSLSWEILLVLEYCDLGSLKEWAANGGLRVAPGGLAARLG